MYAEWTEHGASCQNSSQILFQFFPSEVKAGTFQTFKNDLHVCHLFDDKTLNLNSACSDGVTVQPFMLLLASLATFSCCASNNPVSAASVTFRHLLCRLQKHGLSQVIWPQCFTFPVPPRGKSFRHRCAMIPAAKASPRTLIMVRNRSLQRQRVRRQTSNSKSFQ